jgi:hypothetical protein
MGTQCLASSNVMTIPELQQLAATRFVAEASRSFRL